MYRNYIKERIHIQPKMELTMIHIDCMYGTKVSNLKKMELATESN